MRKAAPILRDRPLDDAGDDVLGMEQLAHGLAAQLEATPGGGLLAGVIARRAGAGRTSFLNLLQLALASRGVPAVHADGERLPHLLASLAAPAGIPAPVVLVDDLTPAALDDLAALPGAAPALVAAVTPLADVEERRLVARRFPVTVELPAWDERAAEELARRLDRRGQGAAPAAAWKRLLVRASSPRDARRLANAAAAAAATSGHAPTDILAAVESSITPSAVRPERELAAHVGRFLAALPPWTGVPADDGPGTEAQGPERRDPAAEARAAGGEEDDIEARRRRCGELGQRGGDEAVRELVRLLGDDHASVRLSACHALAASEDPGTAAAVRPLVGSSEATVRRAAAFVLGRLRDEASRGELVRLLDDVSADARRAAAAALGRIGGVDAARALLLALEDEHAGVRMAVETALLRALGELPPTTFDAFLTDDELACRRLALRAARRLGVGRREVLEEMLAAETDVAPELAEILGRRGDLRSLPALARAAASPRDDVRAAAIAGIGILAGAAPAEGLVGLLRGGDAPAREAAVDALTSCPGAVDALLPCLSDDDAAVRRAAAEALGRCGDPRAVPGLVAMHDRGEPEERRAAAAGLVRLGYGG